MLAVTTTAVPADTDAWATEVKWDGYRALCLRDNHPTRPVGAELPREGWSVGSPRTVPAPIQAGRRWPVELTHAW
jgi:hypothetical protein